jgi:hypothetical protein
LGEIVPANSESLFDFTEVMKKIGQLFVRGLSLRIRQQQGIDGEKYSALKPSTIRGRMSYLKGNTTKGKGRKLDKSSKYVMTTKGGVGKVVREGKANKKGVMKEKFINVPVTRLLFSQDTANRGFESEASKDSVIVRVSMKKHMSMEKKPSISYAEIIGHNSRGQDEVNLKINQPAPLVFPTTPQEVGMMEKEMDFARRLFDAEARRQMKEKMNLNLKKRLVL